jgi:hypothetical protein
MTSVPGAIVRVRLTVALCAGEPESVTLKVSAVFVTATAGVPLINPEAFSESPAGRVPAVCVQVSPGVPPVAASVCE